MWWKSLFRLIRGILRIICVFVFFHWTFCWAFSIYNYANSTSYQDSINKVEEHQQEVEYGGKNNKKTITEIEEEILSEIEQKSSISKGFREWKNNQLPALEILWNERIQLEKNQDGSQNGKEELENKKKNYREKIKNAKEATIKNIRDQLENNNLSITEIDDKRTIMEKFWKDPLKFFFISPLNKISKKSQLITSSLWGEIIFKLLIIKLLYMLVSYSEATLTSLQENASKLQDPTLSLEEKEQISAEISPWAMIGNLMIGLLFNLFIFIHPSFLDKTNPAYFQKANFFYWFLPIIGAGILSNLSGEFVRQGRLLSFREIKAYLVKNWVFTFIFSPLFLFFFSLWFGNIRGSYLFSICSGLVELLLNISKLVFFRKKSDPAPHSTNPFRNNYYSKKRKY